MKLRCTNLPSRDTIADCRGWVVPLPDFVPERGPEAMARIASLVAREFNVPVRQLKGDRRGQEYARPRHLAMLLMKHWTTGSFGVIGRFLGGRDHTTVLHGIRKAEKLLTIDPDMTAAKRRIEAQLGNREAA